MGKTIKTVTRLEELRAARAKLADPVGLVPTMGYLHEGHLSLARRAKDECASVVASIFVNPTQFSPSEDLAKYPRDIPRDLAMLKAVETDLVWIPTPEIMYPEGFQSWVTVEELTQPLEGVIRPGHFRGVTTVVTKLFNAVQPQKAYFGQKDVQQAIVISRMTNDLNFPIEIVICPTVRESDGLAMSSRNIYLNSEERRAANVLYRALSAAKTAYEQGIRDADLLRQTMHEVITSEPLAQSQYISCANYETLEELNSITGRVLLSMAVLIGKIRLIDNIVLE